MTKKKRTGQHRYVRTLNLSYSVHGSEIAFLEGQRNKHATLLRGVQLQMCQPAKADPLAEMNQWLRKIWEKLERLESLPRGVTEADFTTPVVSEEDAQRRAQNIISADW